MEDYHPDKLLYLTDKRQSLHFEQVFRTARKGHLVPPETELQHIGFGTMNGKDGKPFRPAPAASCVWKRSLPTL